MSDIIKMDIDNNKRKIGLNIKNIDGAIGMDVKTGGGSTKVIKQIYIGENEPTDANILIWIDTSTSIIDNQLITLDDMEFITSNDEIFIVEEA